MNDRLSSKNSSPNSVDEMLKRRKIIVTCGTGGVGKTTLSAALALRAAAQGRRTAVITIDPAKRLATSLGLDGQGAEGIGHEPRDLTPLARAAWKKMRAAGVLAAPELGGEFTGEIWAMMPDTRRTFETFIAELLPDAAQAQKLMKNPIFSIFAREFSGANEYMALQSLYGLAREARFDCIILDTPPSRNTLAFLEAPTLLARFFDEKLIHWIAEPANRLVSAGMKKALGMLERLTGGSFMAHLFEFATALFAVRSQFSENLTQITALLKSEQTGFLLVGRPTPEQGEEIDHFIESVVSREFRFEGLALNRTLGYLPYSSAQKAEFGSTEALTLLETLRNREGAAIQDWLGRVKSKLGKRDASAPLFVTLPELARDVHSIEDLTHVALAFTPARV